MLEPNHVQMNYLKLPEELTAEYPYFIRYSFERTSSADGEYECPKIAKTLKAAFDFIKNVRIGVRRGVPMEIDLSFEEVHESKLPLTILKTKDNGIIEWATLERTTPEELSYLLLKSGQCKVVGILEYNEDIVECQWPRSKDMIEYLNLTLAPPQTMNNGDIVQYPLDMSGYKFLALITRI